jgi:hypothetical protein
MASGQTNQRERMAVAEGDEPTAAQTDTAAPLTLKQRMAAIRDECFGIGKDDIEMANADRSKKWKIKGHTVEAVLSEVRPLFTKHGVDMTPQLVERTYSGNRCDVIVDFEFERTDESDEKRVIRWFGADTDNGGKAAAKAGTNALKEMLKKRFLITDRDDAKEEAESVEHRTEAGASREDLDRAKEQRRAAIQQWAATFKAALENAPDKATVDRLRRENSEQLDSDDLPKVTKDFFYGLIADRKAEFE